MCIYIFIVSHVNWSFILIKKDVLQLSPKYFIYMDIYTPLYLIWETQVNVFEYHRKLNFYIVSWEEIILEYFQGIQFALQVYCI